MRVSLHDKDDAQKTTKFEPDLWGGRKEETVGSQSVGRPFRMRGGAWCDRSPGSTFATSRKSWFEKSYQGMSSVLIIALLGRTPQQLVWGGG